MQPRVRKNVLLEGTRRAREGPGYSCTYCLEGFGTLRHLCMECRDARPDTMCRKPGTCPAKKVDPMARKATKDAGDGYRKRDWKTLEFVTRFPNATIAQRLEWLNRLLPNDAVVNYIINACRGNCLRRAGGGELRLGPAVHPDIPQRSHLAQPLPGKHPLARPLEAPAAARSRPQG